jgi:phosphoribosylformylglycinamidine cyclo-ligase
MSVNDILTSGAEPLFFLDYFACGRLDVATATEVIKGIAAGCEQAGCALIGGETAEMPGMYPAEEYDLAGFAVGIVEKSEIIDGALIAESDVLLGLASDGAHANGYSLIRKIVEIKHIDLSAELAGHALSDLILAPTRIYVKPVLKLMKRVNIKGLAHITGGGLIENVPRILPQGLAAHIERGTWPMPPLFTWLKQQGNVADREMYRVFNCGIGMVVVVSAAEAASAEALLADAGEIVSRVGTVRRRRGNGPQTVIV